MAFSPFTYWRRDTWVKPPLKKIPKGKTGPLVYHQLLHGDFEPSPYLKMVDKEWSEYGKEVDKIREDFKSDREGLFEKTRSRLAVYNKRVQKLEEEHWKLDEKRLDLFRKGLKDAFLIDIWDKVMEKYPDTTPQEFYECYKKEVKMINNKIDKRLRSCNNKQ